MLIYFYPVRIEWLFLFLHLKVFLCVPGRTGLPLPVTGQSQGGWGSNFLFSHIYMCVCVYMAGGAKLPRHPSLDSLKPAGARVWLPALCAYMAGGSLDRPLPVARLSQAGCGSTLNPQPRERLRLEYILSRLWVFYAGFFFSLPIIHIFYPEFESFKLGFFFFFFFFCFTLRSDILPRISAVSPFIHIFNRVYQRYTPGFLLHPTCTYFIRTLSLLRRVPGLTHRLTLKQQPTPRIPGLSAGAATHTPSVSV